MEDLKSGVSTVSYPISKSVAVIVNHQPILVCLKTRFLALVADKL